jgi:hypothetical protein
MHVMSQAFFVIVLLACAAAPSASFASIFGKQDVSDLIEIDRSIQSLKEDVALSLKSLPSADIVRIQSFAHLEVSLEAAQERFGYILVQVLLSTSMESQSDEFRILNILYEETLPKSNDYLNSKRNTFLSVATVQSNDRLFVSYCERAASLIGDKAIPTLDRVYASLRSIHR